MPWAAAAAIGGAVITSSASKSAASKQAASADRAADLQQQQYEQTRADNAGYRQRGEQAGNKLQYLMGLGGAGGAGGDAYTAQPLDRETLRNQLLPQFSSTVKPQMYYLENEGAGNGIWGYQVPGGSGGITTTAPADTTTIDEAGLNAEIERRYQASVANAGTYGGSSGQGGDPNDPAYGSLMRKFTMADRDADPVYQSGLQFGLDEGTKAINNRAGAGGSFLSGATLKALTRFGNDYGSTKAGESRNRFVSDQDSQYNRLAGISGTGQSATNQVTSAGNAYATNTGNALMGSGNAQAAGIMGGANAINSGIGQAYSGYQNNQMVKGMQDNQNMLMQMIRNPGGGGGYDSWQQSGSGMPSWYE